jgi:FlgD Ig-like domain
MGCQVFPESDYAILPKAHKKTYFSNVISRSSIEVSGSITENTFWDVDTVKVVGNIQVENEVTLSIAAGTKVEFQNFYSIDIQGSIQAIGEPDNFIYFISVFPELFAIDHSTEGAWNGIRFENTSYSNEPSILQYCIIEYSKNVEENGVGGAISCFDFSKLKIENCVFQNNLAVYGGAIGMEFNSNPILNGNVLTENYAFLGGSPMYCTYSYPKIINNTIVNNTILNEDIFVSTGAIHTFQSKPQLYNNIIWNNTDYFFEDSPLLFCKSFYVEYNDIELGFSGNGNIDLDPEFVSQTDNNFSLQSNSPCIDAGLNELPWNNELTEFDLFGNPRIVGNQVDIGAYEWQNTGTIDQLPITDYKLTNYPNPFNPSTEIRLQISDTSEIGSVDFQIYNIKGQMIRQFSIFNSQSSINWDGTDQNNHPVASGIYFAKVKAGDQILTRKMVLMK